MIFVTLDEWEHKNPVMKVLDQPDNERNWRAIAIKLNLPVLHLDMLVKYEAEDLSIWERTLTTFIDHCKTLITYIQEIDALEDFHISVETPI